MIDDVVAFLQAAHEEIERRAKAAIDYQSGRWEHGDDGTVYVVRDGTDFTAAADPGRCTEHPEGLPNMCDHQIAGDFDHDMAPSDGEARAAHVALHDPRSALARVQAERKVVTRLTSIVRDFYDGHDDAEVMLRQIAYGHRFTVPGYDPGWTPEGAET